MQREIIGAQGEITIFRITVGSMPENVAAHLEVDAQNRPIISHSESGNHHILERNAEVFELQDSPEGMRILYALLDTPTMLVQDASDAHGSHMLAGGLYEFRIAREYDSFLQQARIVAD